MSQHNYTNPAFCHGSEFYPTRGVELDSVQEPIEAIYNRSLNISYGGHAVPTANPRVGPLRLQRSMSTRSVNVQKRPKAAAASQVHLSRLPKQQQHQRQQTQQQRPIKSQFAITSYSHSRNNNNNTSAVAESTAFEARSNAGRYALVPVEDLPSTANRNNRYAIVPGLSTGLARAHRYAKSQDNLDYYGSEGRLQSDEEPASFHEEPHSFHGQSADAAFASHSKAAIPTVQQPQPLSPKIKHAFSSDFGSKTFLIVDKNSNQRYQMVPTAEDEELVDDNHEIIQMHNGRAHRYAVIPTEEEDQMQDAEDEEEETCLSNSDLNRSENFLVSATKTSRNTTLRTSTPQKLPALAQAQNGVNSYPCTPMKNPAATKMLHELLSTPRKTPLPRSVAPRNLSPLERLPENYQQEHQRTKYHYRSQQQLHYTPGDRRLERTTQSLHYESVKTPGDRTMAVITPRITPHQQSKAYPEVEEEEDCSSIHGKSTNSTTPYPQKVANAAITLAVVSLMLVISSSMNTALIIYMIAHFGKSFYLQFSLVAAFSGVGLGFLGFRSRHCEWLPNRSYTSGYILVTVFCLLKCCGLVVILVLDPYPGLPLHDVTTGIILGLSTFTIFFIGLGVVGSLWCYRPPPDNRVNVA
ncbi:uncharacterized protein LOC118736795 [Rhagoletis pomonella]|uniref:uncharacterized protein LOC118736795 n=1 Tax=Rhagoletis pomonella TaxID=28610 RepID=UPI00178592AA|nr:uncharacterized protein LOC118736795 [Rhagoletis pomonella]